MLDEETWAQINGEYVCPAEAGPVWREAVAAGIDKGTQRKPGPT